MPDARAVQGGDARSHSLQPPARRDTRTVIRDLCGNLARPFFWQGLADAARFYQATYFKHLKWRQWYKHPPHWFDHRIDLHTWHEHLNPHWLERGCYSRALMTPGCRVLDISCGDGFYPFYFYAGVASEVHAIDIDAGAIAHARKVHAHPKIKYFAMDAATADFPAAQYDVICFDGAIGHFAPDVLDSLLRRISRALSPDGVLTGYEAMEDDQHQTWDHLIALPDERSFQELLKPYFREVATLALESPRRKNLYFRCSNGDVLSRFSFNLQR